MRPSLILPHRLLRALAPVIGCCSLGILAASCSSEDPCEPATSSSVVLERTTQSWVDKLDLLLAIDNSRSMADKQQILALAIPDLVSGLVNPPCVNPSTGAPEAQPAGPLEQCPEGLVRAQEPLLDVHIGIISSSLGGHGSDACSTSGTGKQSNNDRGRLLARVDPTMAGEVETYQNLKFLAYDPAQKLSPPGEADIDSDTASDANGTALVPQLRDMVLGVGQLGCGYEAQLESWYRFLVDPNPPEEVTLDASGKILLNGTDNVLLDQRKEFLRPSSLLTIIMLSDENDCSIMEFGQFYYAAQQKSASGSNFHLPRARAICDQSPNDQCCFSCGQSGPKNDNGSPICAEDPTCKDATGNTAYWSDADDNINLRCFNQKRRFGIDFLYSIDRYRDALRNQTVTDRTGQVVPNPIFSDLDPSDDDFSVRSPQLVMLAGIVGVPWQDIARTNAGGAPDLQNGVDAYGNAAGGFKNADEMAAPLPGKDYNTWDMILGNPQNYPSPDALPKDPLMVESVKPRTGTNPVTGDPLVTSDTPLGNKINGHERSIPANDDLQYACIFPLAEPLDCSGNLGAPCDCQDSVSDSPLCQTNPATGEPTIQAYAKAYPGIRELHLLKEIGSQGVVASVCPVQMNAPEKYDFGYRAAIGSVLERLRSAVSGQCLQRTLTPDEQGRVDCAIIEGRKVANGCSCGAGRTEVGAEHQGLIDAIKEDSVGATLNCFCEIPQLSGSEPGEPLWACQNDPSPAPVTSDGQPVDGYCYVDQAQGVGNPEIVEKCPATEKRVLRFVGEGAAANGAVLYTACGIENTSPVNPACEDAQN